MKGRYEIRETTDYLMFAQGWQEVVITDRLTGHKVRGRGQTYDEAVEQAWRLLKQAQGIPELKGNSYPSESAWP